jgi:hypothetical protein
MAYIKYGIGDYEPSSYSTEFPWNSLPKGMGCGGDCGCGGTCGGGDHSHGMGLFDSMDPTTWGAGEYIVAGVGGYLAVKLVGDVVGAGKSVKRRVGKRKAAASKREKAKMELSSAGGWGGTFGTVALVGGLAYGAYLLYQKYQAGGGLGDYQAQGFTHPQILVAPGRTSEIQIPAGW